MGSTAKSRSKGNAGEDYDPLRDFRLKAGNSKIVQNGIPLMKSESREKSDVSLVPSKVFKDKLEFGAEMQKQVSLVVSDSICLKRDPREYHRFYLTVENWIKIGIEFGFILENKVNLFWTRCDNFAVDQFEKKDVSLRDSRDKIQSSCLPKTRKDCGTVRDVEGLWRKMISEQPPHFCKDLCTDVIARLEFFQKSKHLTSLEDCDDMNVLWGQLLTSQLTPQSPTSNKPPSELVKFSSEVKSNDPEMVQLRKDQRKAKDAERKRLAVASETPEEREKRLKSKSVRDRLRRAKMSEEELSEFKRKNTERQRLRRLQKLDKLEPSEVAGVKFKEAEKRKEVKVRKMGKLTTAELLEKRKSEAEYARQRRHKVLGEMTTPEVTQVRKGLAERQRVYMEKKYEKESVREEILRKGRERERLWRQKKIEEMTKSGFIQWRKQRQKKLTLEEISERNAVRRRKWREGQEKLSKDERWHQRMTKYLKKQAASKKEQCSEKGNRKDDKEKLKNSRKKSKTGDCLEYRKKMLERLKIQARTKPSKTRRIQVAKITPVVSNIIEDELVPVEEIPPEPVQAGFIKTGPHLVKILPLDKVSLFDALDKVTLGDAWAEPPLPEVCEEGEAEEEIDERDDEALEIVEGFNFVPDVGAEVEVDLEGGERDEETGKEEEGKIADVLVIVNCRLCLEKFASSDELRNHVEISHPDKCWRCPTCNKVMLMPSELVQHFKDNHEDDF